MVMNIDTYKRQMAEQLKPERLKLREP